MEKINLPFGATPINMETKLFNSKQGGPELPTGRVMVSEPPGPEVNVATTSGTGVSKSPKRKSKDQQSSRVGNRKEKWSHEENRFLWKCYEVSCYPSRRGYMKRMHTQWTNGGMRNINSQRLATQVKNIEKRGILSAVEREKIRCTVTGEQEVEHGEEEIVEDSDRLQTDPVTADERTKSDSDPQILAEVEKVVEEMVDVISIVVDSDDEDEEFDGFEISEEEQIIKRIREIMEECKDGDVQIPSIKEVKWNKAKKEIDLVNSIVSEMATENFTEFMRLMQAAGIVIAERLGIHRKAGKKKVGKHKEPWWKRRLESSIKDWRKDLSKLEELKKGKYTLKEDERARMNRRYELEWQGYLYAIHILKSKIQRASVKIRYYNESRLQFHQNKLFDTNQAKLYSELNGEDNSPNEVPEPTEATNFWKGIWSVPSEHNKNADWLKRVKEKMQDLVKQEDIEITVEDVKNGIRRMSNWKAPGPDGVQGFWFKKLTAFHERIAKHLQECLNSGIVPDWLTLGRTVLIMKDRRKGNVASNYRPIACLPLIWKLLTGIFAEKLYNHLLHNSLLPDEQKGCRKDSRGTKDQLLIDKAILRNSRRTCKGLAIGWIDYKKAYDMVPHSWLKEVAEMFGMAENIKTLLFDSMNRWKTVLTANNEVIGEVEIKRGIFQGDTLSPLLFIMVLIPLSMVLKEMDCGYQFTKGGVKVNHLLFMDDLKLYGKSERELNSLVNTVHIFSEDIGMKFGMDKCNVMVMERGKMKQTTGIKLPDGEVMKQIEKDGYKYLGMIQDDQIRHKEMKLKLETEYLRRVKKVAKSKLYSGKMFAAINAWAVGVIRYSAGIVDWTMEDIKRMDVKTRKTLTMNGAFHPRASVDRLYLRRREGGRGLLSVEECVQAEMKGLWEYVSESTEPMLQEVNKEDMFVRGERKDAYQKKLREQRMHGFENKSLHGKFRSSTKEVADERSWEWLKAGYVKKGTEAIITAAQDQALRTNWIKAKIDKQDCSPLCRLCHKEDESAMHIASGCEVLAKRQYKLRHDLVGRRVHWEVCKKHGIKCSEKWFDHIPEKVSTTTDSTTEVLWDLEIETQKKVKHNRPDIVIKEHDKKKWIFVDVTVPMDHRVAVKESEKIDKYLDLATEVKRDHTVKVEIIPVVIGALGTIPKGLKESIKKLEIPDITAGAQISVLIGTGKILRNVLSL